MKPQHSPFWVLFVLTSLVASAISAHAADPVPVPQPNPPTQQGPRPPVKPPVLQQNGGDTSAGAHSADGMLLDFKERQGITRTDVEKEEVYRTLILPRLKQLEAIDPKLVKLMKESFEDRRWFWDSAGLVCSPTATMRDLDLKVRACQDKYEIRMSKDDLANASPRELAGTIVHEMVRYARFEDKPECFQPLLREQCEKDVRQITAEVFEGDAIDPKGMKWVLNKAKFTYPPRSERAAAPDQAEQKDGVGEKPATRPSAKPLSQSVLDLLCATEKVAIEEQLEELEARAKGEREQLMAAVRGPIVKDAAQISAIFDRIDVAADKDLRSLARDYASNYRKLVSEMNKRGLSWEDQRQAIWAFDGRYRHQMLPILKEIVLREIEKVTAKPNGLSIGQTVSFYLGQNRFELAVQDGKVGVIVSKSVEFPMAHNAFAELRQTIEIASGARKGVPSTADPSQVPVQVLEDALNLQAFSWGGGPWETGNALLSDYEASTIKRSGILESCRKSELTQQALADSKAKAVPGNHSDPAANHVEALPAR